MERKTQKRGDKSWGERRGKRSPALFLFWIKGLRKYVLMEVNCSQWEPCDRRSGQIVWKKRRARGVLCKSKEGTWRLCVSLRLYSEWPDVEVRGQSDNHICKHTSSPWAAFWRYSCLTQSSLAGKCLQCINVREERPRVQSATLCPVYLGTSLLNNKRQGKNNCAGSIIQVWKDTHTHTINSSSASGVCEESPLWSCGTWFFVISAGLSLTLEH